MGDWGDLLFFVLQVTVTFRFLGAFTLLGQ